jgi:hypothetical protein
MISRVMKSDSQGQRDNYETKLEALRRAIEEGIASGIAEGDVFARVRAKFGLKPRSKTGDSEAESR